jgi:hypothetical protein
MNQHVRDNMNILITPMTTVGALFTTDDITMTATKKLYLSTAQNTYWTEAATSVVDAYVTGTLVFRVAKDPSRVEVAGFDNSTGVGSQAAIGPNTNAGTPAPGCLVLFDKSATARYLWATTEGLIMTGAAAPDDDSDTGGTQL